MRRVAQPFPVRERSLARSTECFNPREWQNSK